MNTQETIKVLDQLMRSEKLHYDTEATDALHHAIEHMKRGAPEGWRLVPKKPTGPQIMAGIHFLEQIGYQSDKGSGPLAVEFYRAMIEAHHE